MWYLVENEPQDGPQLRYWLGGVKPSGILIGRKNVHIRIKQTSVSRAHATLRVVKASRYSLSKRGMPNTHVRSTGVEIEDSSAYGTYVKYPVSDSEVGETAQKGHHIRLGKSIATEISEGAHLAFGAPNSWWRLAWYNVLCFVPDYQPESVSELVNSAAWSGGIEVSKKFSSEVTHVIVEKARSDCMALITALARGAHIVTPAWLSSVQHTVEEACKLITEAANNEAAFAASRLADEAHFAPKFSDADKRNFGAEMLEKVFSTPIRARRSLVFKNRAFAFVNEDTLEKWTSILEKMGARTLLAGALRKSNRAGVVIIEEDTTSPKRKRARKSFTAENRSKVTEHSLITAILSGDESHVTESETNDDIDELIDVEESRKKRSSEKSTEKRLAGDLQDPAKTVVDIKPSSDCVDENADIVDSEDLNERVSIKMRPLVAVKKNLPKTSKYDVRPFRRRNLPKVSEVPLKKARYVDEDEEFFKSSHDHERKSRSNKLRADED